MGQQDNRPRAGAWQRAQAEEWLHWRNSDSSRRQSRLEEIARAVDAVVRQGTRDKPTAQEVIRQLEPTLARCDSLQFDVWSQAVAYTLWHVVDRYGRIGQVLDALFQAGHLPIRRRRMAVLDVGAGPAPALYATSDYFDDLALLSEATAQPLSVLTPTDLHVLDRGPVWGHMLHSLSEHLLIQGDGRRRLLPFGVTYRELAGFSVRSLHWEGIESASRELQAEADTWDEYLDPRAARERVLAEGGYPPSAYDLIVMCNFLTNHEITSVFADELLGLSRSLTPGGVLLVVGSAAPTYESVYRNLKSIIKPANLRELALRGQPFTAHSVPSQQQAVWDQVRTSLSYLSDLAPQAFQDVRPQLPHSVRQLRETPPTFPKFVALAFKNQRPPSHARRAETSQEVRPR